MMKKFFQKIHRIIGKLVDFFMPKKSHIENDEIETKFTQYEINSRNLLNLFREDHYSFTIVPIPKNEKKQKELLRYCVDHPTKFILITANEAISRKAKRLSAIPSTTSHSNVTTLKGVKRIGKKLILSDFNTKDKNICVISNGREIFEGPFQLSIGDEIFIAVKNRDHCTFSHFKVISLGLENNCVLIYHTQLNNMKKINGNLPRDDYQRFVRSFKIRHDM